MVTGREAVNQLFINQTIVVEFTGGHICVSMHKNIKQKWERKQKDKKWNLGEVKGSVLEAYLEIVGVLEREHKRESTK